MNGKRRKACCYRLSNINHVQVFTQVFVLRTFTDLSFFLKNTFDSVINHDKTCFSDFR